jgi:citrate lyase subunit beta / citryl-CoA lyase
MEKARTLPCDVVILDLEDAVAPESKAQARAQAVAALLAGGFGDREVVVRVNALDTPWGADDLDAVLPAAPHAILVPKVSRRDDLRRHEQRLAGHAGTALWAMIETAASIFRVEEIASAAADGRLAALVVGTNDLVKEAGFRPGADRQPLLGALGLIVLAARAHGLAVLDGVFNALDDLDGLAAQCAQGVAFGFDGKTLIHPGQVEPCNQAFTPDADAVAAARRILAAFAAPENAGRGALRVDGMMVERLHLVQARRTLAMAGAADQADGA